MIRFQLDLQKIKQLREKRGFRQYEMAKWLGYKSSMAYHHLETGRCKVSANQVPLFSFIFKVPIMELYRKENTESEGVDYVQQTWNQAVASQDTERLVQLFSQIVKMLEDNEQKQKQPLVLTTKDVAELMQISVPSLRDHFLCRPDFPKIRAGSRYLVPYQALLQWLNEQV